MGRFSSVQSMARSLASSGGKPGLNATEVVLDAVPTALLETFIPGFGIISTAFEAFLGIDITTVVSFAFVVAASAGAGHYVWRAFSRFFFYWFTSTITINSNDRLFEQIMFWHSRHDFAQGSRSLGAKTSKRSEDLAAGKSNVNQTNYDYAEIESSVPPQYIPAYGHHVFWFNGWPIFLTLEKQPQSGVVFFGGSSEKDVPQSIHMTCLGRSANPIKRFIMQCKRFEALSNRSTTTIRRSTAHQNANWQRALERPSRPLDTVYMDESIKRQLIRDIQEFIDPMAPRFYARRGIPYRRGYLFWGPPGTGKTSLSFALAGHFGFDLYVVSLREPFMSEFKLTELFAKLPAHCIVLLEDVDTAGLEKRDADKDRDKTDGGSDDAKPAKTSGVRIREDSRQVGSATITTKAPEGITLSGLLNAIDGVASHEGRLLIMTTNDPESLDKALIRPGRVDMQVYFGLASKSNARQIFLKMYTMDDAPSNAEVLPAPAALADPDAASKLAATAQDNDEVELLASRFAEIVPDLTFTPAEVQGFLLTRKKSPRAAIDDAVAWRDSLLAARATGKNVLGPVPNGTSQEGDAAAAPNGA